MREVLEPFGFRVDCVDAPAEAVRQMRIHRYDVVVLDYQLPELNGNELIGALQIENPSAKFVVISGMDASELVEDKFRGMGSFAFFDKGKFSVSEFRETILEAFSDAI